MKEDFLRLYIDECGHDQWPSKEDHRDRFLGICGVLVKDSEYLDGVYSNLASLKRRFFSFDIDERLPLHRNEIVRATGRFALLKAPAIRHAFDEALLAILENTPYSPIVVVIDKARLRELYPKPADPYFLALTYLLQRAFHFAKRIGLKVHVAAERRMGNRDRSVGEAYAALRHDRYLGGLKFAIAPEYWFPREQILFYSKDQDIAGLQIADLLARPMTAHSIRLSDRGRVPAPSPFETALMPIVSRKCSHPLDAANRGYSWTIFPPN